MIDKRFYADVGFVKHGHPCFEDLWETFQKDYFGEGAEDIIAGFTALYERTCFGGNHYYPDMQKFIFGGLDLSEELAAKVEQILHYFFISVYSSAWRCRFLEAVDKAGIQLALYGNDWEQHKRLGHLARGPVDHDTELNYVYNHNKINLSITSATSMHQRLSECALAGGFMMVADPGQGDWGSARRYFSEDELIIFKTPEELVAKCHYYLGHHADMKKGRHAIDIKGAPWIAELVGIL